MDFILSTDQSMLIDLNSQPDWFPNTRRARDQSGSFFGPINYQGFQRKPKNMDFSCFFRIGYIELLDQDRLASLLKIFGEELTAG